MKVLYGGHRGTDRPRACGGAACTQLTHAARFQVGPLTTGPLLCTFCKQIMPLRVILEPRRGHVDPEQRKFRSLLVGFFTVKCISLCSNSWKLREE